MNAVLQRVLNNVHSSIVDKCSLNVVVFDQVSALKYRVGQRAPFLAKFPRIPSEGYEAIAFH